MAVSFSRIQFSPGSLHVRLQVLGHHQRVVGYFHNACATVAPAHLEGRSPLEAKTIGGFVAGIGLYFSSGRHWLTCSMFDDVHVGFKCCLQQKSPPSVHGEQPAACDIWGLPWCLSGNKSRCNPFLALLFLLLLLFETSSHSVAQVGLEFIILARLSSNPW